MAHLIDKDALLAWAKEAYLCENASMIRKVCYKQLLEHLDTLEAKEVDFEKEIEKYAYSLPHSATGATIYVSDIKSPIAREFGVKHDWSYEYVEQIAEHFFELGLSVNSPITASDRGMAEEIIVNLKRVENDYHINLTREMEWLRNQVKKIEL